MRAIPLLWASAFSPVSAPRCVWGGGEGGEGLGRLGPEHIERHRGPQHPNTKMNQRKNEVAGEGLGNMHMPPRPRLKPRRPAV